MKLLRDRHRSVTTHQAIRRKVRKVDEIAALLKRLLEDPEDTTSQRQPSVGGAKQDRIPRDGDMERGQQQAA
ncbi:hypothetical protein D917_10562, partial [Trichinella nativa]